jgi:hypothetical protein
MPNLALIETQRITMRTACLADRTVTLTSTVAGAASLWLFHCCCELMAIPLLLRAYGYSTADVIGTYISKYIHPTVIAEITRHYSSRPMPFLNKLHMDK